MDKNTFLICDKCGGEVLWVTQVGDQVNAATPKEQFAFTSKHIHECWDGEPPSPANKEFHTEMRNADGEPLANAASGLVVGRN